MIQKNVVGAPQDSPPLPDTGAVVADKYQIERVLGRGGNGTVLLARHLVTGKHVALKWIGAGRRASPDDLERLIREAKAAARTRHPNIVDIYDVDEHEGAVFLVMEYLHGQPLSGLLRDTGLSPSAILRTLQPLIAGVRAAHNAGVVHRDLKPDNLFVIHDAEGHMVGAKVLDFGIAKLRDPLGAQQPPTLTTVGMMLGSPHYMAPEQFEDAKSVDHRADIYSLGVILYEALAGRLPYDADRLTGLLLKISRHEHEPLTSARPELPPGLPEVVERCMALRPEDRYRDAGALLAALQPFASDALVTTDQHEPASEAASDTLMGSAKVRTPPEPRTRMQFRSVAILAIAAALLAGAFLVGRQQMMRPQPAMPAAHPLVGKQPGIADGPAEPERVPPPGQAITSPSAPNPGAIRRADRGDRDGQRKATQARRLRSAPRQRTGRAAPTAADSTVRSHSPGPTANPTDTRGYTRRHPRGSSPPKSGRVEEASDGESDNQIQSTRRSPSRLGVELHPTQF